RTTILAPQGRVLAGALSEALAGPMDAAVGAAGVVVRSERVARIEADPHGRVRVVRTDRGEVVGCQVVLVAVGVVPRVELAEAAGVELGVSGAVAVDAGMRTN